VQQTEQSNILTAPSSGVNQPQQQQHSQSQLLSA
jgi:hypothetical protein